MRLDLVIAIVEIFGAIGVIVTLVYLALQVRQNWKSVQGSTMQSLVELEVTTYSLIAQYANVYRRGCLDISDLDEDEYIIFEQLVTTEMSLMYSAFTQYKNGLMDEYNSYLLDWGRIYLKQPGFLGVWNKMKDNWPMDFCETLDDVEQATKHDA